jgi:hypothetical protein
MGDRIKYLLTRVGERLTPGAIHNLNAAVNYLEIGRWMRAHGYPTSERYARRERLFDMVGAQVGDKQALYMEFGVHKGEATRYWSKLLRNPNSKLHGFDSFEGLPESYNEFPPGQFSLRGTVPQVDDDRVQFFKGWFSETLADYEMPPHEVLILNLDADLYSSTIFVLKTLRKEIVAGTYLYFDEIYDRSHELRAFDDFLRETGMRFRLLGATTTLGCALFQRTS